MKTLNQLWINNSELTLKQKNQLTKWLTKEELKQLFYSIDLEDEIDIEEQINNSVEKYRKIIENIFKIDDKYKEYDYWEYEKKQIQNDYDILRCIEEYREKCTLIINKQLCYKTTIKK